MNKNCKQNVNLLLPFISFLKQEVILFMASESDGLSYASLKFLAILISLITSWYGPGFETTCSTIRATMYKHFLSIKIQNQVTAVADRK